MPDVQRTCGGACVKTAYVCAHTLHEQQDLVDLVEGQGQLVGGLQSLLQTTHIVFGALTQGHHHLLCFLQDHNFSCDYSITTTTRRIIHNQQET